MGEWVSGLGGEVGGGTVPDDKQLRCIHFRATLLQVAQLGGNPGRASQVQERQDEGCDAQAVKDQHAEDRVWSG